MTIRDLRDVITAFSGERKVVIGIPVHNVNGKPVTPRTSAYAHLAIEDIAVVGEGREAVIVLKAQAL